MVVSDTKKHPYIQEDECEGHSQDKEMYDRLKENIEKLKIKEQKRQQEIASYRHNEMLYRFAGQAMQGLMANSLISTEDNYHWNIAHWSINQAKALIAALDEGE